MNTGSPSRSRAMSPRLAAMKRVELARLIGLDPAAHLEPRRLEIDRQRVFGLKPLRQHVELQRTDDADDGRRAVIRQEQLDDALLGHLRQRFAQLLGLHGVLEPDAAQDFRGEARHAAEHDVLALGQRIADPQRAVIGDADHVAGKRLLGQCAVLGEEELRRRQRSCGLPVRTSFTFMPRCSLPEQTRTKAMRSRWLGSMLAWILNTKPVIAGSSASTGALVGLLRPRRRRDRRQGLDQVAHAEVAERAAEVAPASGGPRGRP